MVGFTGMMGYAIQACFQCSPWSASLPSNKIVNMVDMNMGCNDVYAKENSLPLPHPNSLCFSHHKPLVSIGASCNNFFNYLSLLKWSLEVAYGPTHWFNQWDVHHLFAFPSSFSFFNSSCHVKLVN